MDRCPFGDPGIAADYRKVAIDGRALSEFQVAARYRHISRNGMSGLYDYRSPERGDIAGHVTAHVNRAKGTGDIACRLTLGDRDVGPEGRTIVVPVLFCLRRQGKSEQ
jgi:hypothetical protein